MRENQAAKADQTGVNQADFGGKIADKLKVCPGVQKLKLIGHWFFRTFA